MAGSSAGSLKSADVRLRRTNWMMGGGPASGVWVMTELLIGDTRAWEQCCLPIPDQMAPAYLLVSLRHTTAAGP